MVKTKIQSQEEVGNNVANPFRPKVGLQRTPPPTPDQPEVLIDGGDSENDIVIPKLSIHDNGGYG